MTTATATDVRAVRMSAEQAQFLEELICDLIRAGDNVSAEKLMVISLAYKFARGSDEPEGELAGLYVLHGDLDAG